MPPKLPKGFEGDPQLEKLAEAEVAQLSRKFGMSPAEAEALIAIPMEWIDRLYEDKASADEIYNEVIAVTDQFEATHGPSEHWDAIRKAMAGALITYARFELAANLLVRMENTRDALGHAVKIVMRSIQDGRLNVTALFELSETLQVVYSESGKSDEFISEGFESLYSLRPDLRGVAGEQVVTQLLSHIDFAPPTKPANRKSKAATPPLPEFDRHIGYEQAAEQYPDAPWSELGYLAEDINNWPDGMDIHERLRLVIDFGMRLSDAVGDAKVQGKKAEAIKAFIADCQEDRGGAAWDRLRLMAALVMYDNGGEKFGRIFARSMTDPNMMAMVVHALLERRRDKDAMDVMQDIPDYKVFGKMLALGDWQDQERIAVIIEDVTVVLPTARRKHDPAFRIGVAEGLYEHHAGLPGDAASGQAQKFRDRADLLKRQIDSRYIVATRKR